jgi:hypothetical protein
VSAIEAAAVSRWFARPTGDLLVLRRQPQPLSWNNSRHPDQLRLREYLQDTAELVSTVKPDGPWTLLLGLPDQRDLLDAADLDNYAYPLAALLRDEHLVSVWCSKRHSEESLVGIAQAQEAAEPATTHRVRTTASSDTRAYKEQVRSGVVGAEEVAEGPVALQISFTVGPRRNWLNLWKPTIDALDPLLGRTRPDRDWHPRDGRVTELGLHMTTDRLLGNDVVVAIAASAG